LTTEAKLDRTSIHENLSVCLRQLRPADYELRCLNAARAEQTGEAASWAVHAALHRQREGLTWRELPDAVLEALDGGGMRPVAERFDVALLHLNLYRFDGCLEALAGLPRNLPRSLVAEADYLRATCLMATRSEADREEARILLSGWTGYEEVEPEIGVRILQLLLYGLAMLRDKTLGLTLEGKVQNFLAGRAAFDSAAEDARYTLDRCAGSLYTPERAVIRTRDAVDHFGPQDDQTVLRRPVEYYRCLVNRGALLLLNARYDEAQSAHVVLEELVASYADGVFPRLDYPRMNGLLADYRVGAVDIEEAVRRQESIVDSHEVPGDPFYVENALAVYLILAGRVSDGLAKLDRLHTELTSRRDPEPSMLYLIRANRCAARYVSGAITDACPEWEALFTLVERIPYSFHEVLTKRHKLLAEIMVTGEEMSAGAFDTCLLERFPEEFGPLWAQLGRGFRMPEIQWWR